MTRVIASAWAAAAALTMAGCERGVIRFGRGEFSFRPRHIELSHAAAIESLLHQPQRIAANLNRIGDHLQFMIERPQGKMRDCHFRREGEARGVERCAGRRQFRAGGFV